MADGAGLARGLHYGRGESKAARPALAMGEVVQRYGAALSRTHRAPSRLSRWSSPAMGEVARGGRSGFFLSHACYATPFRRERSERWLPALPPVAAKRARRDATAAVSAEFHPL